MSRYRKISVRMWGDEKFLQLSKPLPNAQTLWLYLLTGPHTTALPGAFNAGEAGLSEALGWSLKAFRKAFLELFGKGMIQADWKARLVFIPNAIRHNPPESPNVVKSWKSYFEELGDCPLKTIVFAHYQVNLFGKYGEAFNEAFPEGYAYVLPKDYGESGTGTGTGTGKASKEGGYSEAFGEFWNSYPRHDGKSAAFESWQKIQPSPELQAIIQAAIERDKQKPQWLKDDGQFIPYAATWLNQKRWDDGVTDEPVRKMAAVPRFVG